MAMNKKEQAEFHALRTELAIVSALRWTAPVERDLPPPASGERMSSYTSGFDFNAHSVTVSPAWSSSTVHSIGYAAPSKYSASQNCRTLFSTKLKALQAMRYEVELASAKKLAGIDKMIAEETNSKEQS